MIFQMSSPKKTKNKMLHRAFWDWRKKIKNKLNRTKVSKWMTPRKSTTMTFNMIIIVSWSIMCRTRKACQWHSSILPVSNLLIEQHTCSITSICKFKQINFWLTTCKTKATKNWIFSRSAFYSAWSPTSKSSTTGYAKAMMTWPDMIWRTSSLLRQITKSSTIKKSLTTMTTINNKTVGKDGMTPMFSGPLISRSFLDRP